jgi:TonB family protein
MTAADSLRVALGWGARNQDHTTAPKAVQGTLGGDATPLGGTATVLPEEATPDGQAGVSAVATPTGRYIAEVEALVVERWNAIPVPPDQVAMGVSGTVVVELRIDRSGRVLDVRIVKHSGFPILDMQARNAIPERVPRIPHDVPQDVIVERVTMRTRNATPARTAP